MLEDNPIINAIQEHIQTEFPQLSIDHLDYHGHEKVYRIHKDGFSYITLVFLVNNSILLTDTTISYEGSINIYITDPALLDCLTKAIKLKLQYYKDLGINID